MGIEASVESGTGVGGDEGVPPRRRVLVTGAAGRIGSNFARGHGEHHDNAYDLRLMVRGDEEGIDDIRPLGEVVTADLADLDALKAIFEGVDTVVHLAGDPSASAVWKDLLAANVVGTYHVFAAAKAQGVRRVVYASSIHAVSGYAPDVQVKAHDPVNPGDLYGVSKCFGEALCRYMAEQEGVRAVAIRIGAFQPVEKARDPKSLPMLDAFLSHRDMNQLLVRSIEAPDTLRFALVHGISDNRFKRLDISSARDLLGYAPEDDFTEIHPQLEPLRLPAKVSGHNVSDPGQKSGLREEVGEAG
ncbi:MAG TPA: NAD(P)-dependent oxidoreductase [Armatimonadaceae bacterium]|nr:NAD(P)-dependent oxidoreductase [Armatimonadaceae bacterium]